LLTEYVVFTSFILIRPTRLHNAVRKFGTFFMRHPDPRFLNKQLILHNFAIHFW